jgi:L-lysine 2,3-aminomutase
VLPIPLPHSNGTTITSLDDLLTFCDLSVADAPYRLVSSPFAVRVPVAFANNITKGDWLDPLLLQVLPRAQESTPSPEHFTKDPVGDAAAVAVRGVLHKYRGRALLLASSTCAIHCRYCFRREGCCRSLPTDGSQDNDALNYLRNDPTITEVILSGGDPLMLSDRRLRELLNRIKTIPHLATLRIHTRVPTVLPTRITTEFIRLLRGATEYLTGIMVVHVNHPNELNREAVTQLQSLRNAGMLLLNQSVLLRGVNDSSETLKTLSARLIASGVVPCYLHQLDRVCGSHHFEIDETEGKRIISRMQSEQAGYAVPRYVREVPGAPGKQPL